MNPFVGVVESAVTYPAYPVRMPIDIILFQLGFIL